MLRSSEAKRTKAAGALTAWGRRLVSGGGGRGETLSPLGNLPLADAVWAETQSRRARRPPAAGCPQDPHL